MRVVDSHKEIKGFSPSYLITSFQYFISPFLTNICGGGRSMMTICYIGRRNLRKGSFKKVRIFLGAKPESMFNLVITNCGRVGLSSLSNGLHSLLDVFSTLESEENWADIGTLIISDLCPICLLLICGQLMSLNKSLFIVINCDLSYNTILSNIAHFLAIDVHPCLVVLLEVPQFLELF